MAAERGAERTSTRFCTREDFQGWWHLVTFDWAPPRAGKPSISSPAPVGRLLPPMLRAHESFVADPLVDEEAEQIINPRPSSKHFATLAEREAMHAALFHEGVVANAAGDLDMACTKFSEAYCLLFRTTTLLSLVNMKLKVGEAELAAACYAKMLRDNMLSSPAELKRVQTKFVEARQLHADVRAIVEAPQSALLNTPEEREKAHRKLVERAKAANDRGDRAEAERLFLEAWPLLFRVATLISAANMMVHLGGRHLRMAIGVYHALLRGSAPRLAKTTLAPEEHEVLVRKLGEATRAVGEASKHEAAARYVQAMARGKLGRSHAKSQHDLLAANSKGRRRFSLAGGGRRSLAAEARAMARSNASSARGSAGGRAGVGARASVGVRAADPRSMLERAGSRWVDGEDDDEYGTHGDGYHDETAGDEESQLDARRRSMVARFTEDDTADADDDSVVRSPQNRIRAADRAQRRVGADQVAMRVAKHGQSAAGGRGLAILAEYAEGATDAPTDAATTPAAALQLFGVRLPFANLFVPKDKAAEPTGLQAGAMIGESGEELVPQPSPPPNPPPAARHSLFGGAKKHNQVMPTRSAASSTSPLSKLSPPAAAKGPGAFAAGGIGEEASTEEEWTDEDDEGEAEAALVKREGLMLHVLTQCNTVRLAQRWNTWRAHAALERATAAARVAAANGGPPGTPHASVQPAVPVLSGGGCSASAVASPQGDDAESLAAAEAVRADAERRAAKRRVRQGERQEPVADGTPLAARQQVCASRIACSHTNCPVSPTSPTHIALSRQPLLPLACPALHSPNGGGSRRRRPRCSMPRSAGPRRRRRCIRSSHTRPRSKRPKRPRRLCSLRRTECSRRRRPRRRLRRLSLGLRVRPRGWRRS